MLVKLHYGGENEIFNFLKKKMLDDKALERTMLPERRAGKPPRLWEPGP